MATVYSFTFASGSGVDGWQLDGGAGGGTPNSDGLGFYGSEGPDPSVFKTLTGLTPGVAYTLTTTQVWQSYGNGVKVSVDGLGASAPTMAEHPGATLSLAFTATASTHVIRVSGSGYGDGRFKSVAVTFEPPPPIHFEDFSDGMGDLTTVASVVAGSGDGPGAVTTTDGRAINPTTYLQVGQGGDWQFDSAILGAEVAAGGGVVEFWARRESETDYDFNHFFIDGVEQYGVSGISGWTKFSYPLTEGAHTLRWRYDSDQSASAGIGGQRITAITVTNFAGTVPVTLDPPVADFTFTASDLTVTLTDTSTGGDPLSGEWDFGDGDGWFPGSTTHTYAEPGTYAVTLTLVGEDGQSTLTKQVSVGLPPPPVPVAGFTAVPNYLEVSFVDTSSNSPTSWSWAFGDGATSTARNPSHTYASAGSYQVTLTVSSADGSDSETKTVTTTAPPAAPVNLMTDLKIEVETSTGVWTDITGPSKSASINRADSEPGTLQVEVLDANLDPRKSASIRLGKAVRIRAKINSVWRAIYTGQLDNVEVDEDPLAKQAQRVNVKLSALDNTSVLANTTESRGVGTINHLRWVIGSAVPFRINGQTTTLSTGTIVARNENASLWDQILVTRDSNLGYAWVDMDNRLNVYDAASMDSSIKASLTPQVYREIDVDFALDQIINSVVVNWRRYNIGTETAVDVAYGPFEDASSVSQWGRRQATFTVQGATEVEANIAAFAQDVLSRNAAAEVRARSVSIIIATTNQLALARDIELNSRVSVTHPDATVQELRVVGIQHSIEPTRWTMTLELAKPLALTPPSVTPGTGVSPIPPGSIGDDELDGPLKTRLEDITATANAAAQDAANAAQSATTALQAANGKNRVWYSTSGPGSTSNTAGDIWFQKDTSQRIIAQWEGLGGTSWGSRQIRNEVIANLDAGKLIAGSAFTNALSVKTNLTLGDASTNGVIQSYNFANSSVGVFIDKNGLVAKGGSIAGATITGSTIANAAVSLTPTNLTVKQTSSMGGTISLDGNGKNNNPSIRFTSQWSGSGQPGQDYPPARFHCDLWFDASGNLKLDGFDGSGTYYKGIVLSAPLEVNAGVNVNSTLTATRLSSPDTYANLTTTAAANVYMTTGGTLARSTSLRDSKLVIETLPIEASKALLDLDVRTWFDRRDSEALAALLDGDPHACDTTDPLHRIPGLIAEEVEEAGCEVFTMRDANGGLAGVAYERIGVALIPLVKELYARIEALEQLTTTQEGT